MRVFNIKIFTNQNKCNKVLHACMPTTYYSNNYMYLHRTCSFITAENIEFTCIMNCYLSLKLLQLIFAKIK